VCTQGVARDSPDVDSMQGYGLDLSNCADVRASAAEIYEAFRKRKHALRRTLAQKGRLALFKRLMDECSAP
jgi:hypothetical protein